MDFLCALKNRSSSGRATSVKICHEDVPINLFINAWKLKKNHQLIKAFRILFYIYYRRQTKFGAR